MEKHSNVTRRSFLALASLGAGIAVLATPLKGLLPGRRSNTQGLADFPGEDSIFHPRRDPRQVAREKRGF